MYHKHATTQTNPLYIAHHQNIVQSYLLYCALTSVLSSKRERERLITKSKTSMMMTTTINNSANVRMTGMMTLLMCMFVAQQRPQVVVMAMSKDIRFASPLQSLTIPDQELFADKVAEEVDAAIAVDEKKSAAEKKQDLLRSSRILDTPRKKFLPKFLTGLKAENQIREEIALGEVKIPDSDDEFDVSGKDWVGKTKTEEAKRKRRENKVVEDAYDKAITSFEQEQLLSKKIKKTNSNKYQYVGVVLNKDKKNKMNTSPISWYARPKPKSSKWSVRLLHVNKDVIIKDLFDQGKIDIFAKYTNNGQRKQSDNDSEEGKPPKQSSQAPVVTTKYEARERSWKTLWNFSPKHFFTDSSGAYWRERRLREGMYTDGETVYESSYRYRDGRNGMNRVSTLQQFLSSKSVDTKDKQRILKKLKSASPDIVLEM